MKFATVSQINGYIKRILDSNEVLSNIWIKGEISNFKPHYSGHLYITLKDEGGVLKSVMFKSNALRLAFSPCNGMKVLARGRVSVYEAGGAYQFYIEEMIPDGVGALYIAYEQLKEKLRAEGLFDEAHKKPIPKFPNRVGVVTAANGAAVRDIINVITRRYPLAEIILFPTLVQGDSAAYEIAAAVNYFNQTDGADVLIVGRGGGSIEDLWAFNEEIVARAVYNSHIPVISAVGHETDFTIADFVADLRAPTPSAAAELAVPSAAELYANTAGLYARLLQAQSKLLEYRRMQVNNLKLKGPRAVLDEKNIRLSEAVQSMEKIFSLRVMEKRKSFSESCARLEALSPLSVMARGYAIAQKEDGSVIRTVRELSEGEKFELRLADGAKKCQVM